MSGFTHLHVHSQYSLLDGAADTSLMIKKIKENGMQSIALTDHGNLMGVKEFHEACISEGIKPIIGCEVYVAARTIHDKSDKIDRSGYHLILLAKNLTGYKNLSKLVTIAQLEGEYYKPRIDKNLLEKHKEGLIVCSACLGGEVPKHIINGDIPKAEETIKWHKNLFGDDYYLEIMLHETEVPNAKETIYENQLKANKEIIELSKKHDVKLVATNDVHFINKEDAGAHDLLICLNTGKDIDDPKRMRYTGQEWLKTKEEMHEIFSYIPEALSNTMEVADKVEVFDLDHKPIMPLYPIPESFGSFEQYKEKFSEQDLINEFGTDSYKTLGENYEKTIRIKLESDFLEHMVKEGAKKHYGEDYGKEVSERISFEINTIKTMGFPGYFLIVQDFVNKAKEMGVLVGPGRGSAAGSIVAFCTGITNIDPVKYNLLFERFLNPDRISMPDVDIDFDDDNREKVIDYVIKKYGEGKVAHICTFLRMKAKMAIRDVGRVLKLPLNEVNAFLKKFPENVNLDNTYNYILDKEKELGSLQKLLPYLDKEQKRLVAANEKTSKINQIELKRLFVNEIINARENGNETMLKTMAFACTLEGCIRQSGVHPCGVLIGKNNLIDNIPLMQSKDTPEIPSTQYDGNYVEKIGLLKMDFLGLRTLSIIKDCIENIKLRHGIDIDIDSIDPEDEKAFTVFQQGNTAAIFQFESEGMRKSLRRLKPNRFEDLVAMNALYRPGPMDYIPNYIARKHGKEKITYDHPIMEKYLSETYGITVFQEQVMLLSRELAGFTRGESDTLRKAIGKKDFALMDKLHAKFIEGCKNNPEFIEGCKSQNKSPDELINKIWTDWVAFANYAFNKSHSVCYAQIAYITAFLKAQYPAEFMAGNLSRNLSDITKIMGLMKECSIMKLSVLGPSVNESFRNFTVNDAGQIRFGMGGIKNVGTNAVENIIKERENNGAFKDIYDFMSRVNLSIVTKKNIEALAYAGAFDEFSEIKRHQFFNKESEQSQSFIEELMKFGSNMQSQSNSGMTLFGEMDSIEVKKPEISGSGEFNKIELLNQEKDHIGMYLSGHPLDNYKTYLKFIKLENLADLNNDDYTDNLKDFRIAGYITDIQERITKNGKPYGTISLIDYSGSYTFSLFGKEYIDNKSFFIVGVSLLINAKFTKSRKDESSKYFTVNSIKMLDEIQDKYFKNLKICLSYDAIDSDFTSNFVKNIENNKGNLNVSLHIIDSNEKTQIKLFSRTHRVSLNEDFINFIDMEPAIDKYELST